MSMQELGVYKKRHYLRKLVQSLKSKGIIFVDLPQAMIFVRIERFFFFIILGGRSVYNIDTL